KRERILQSTGTRDLVECGTLDDAFDRDFELFARPTERDLRHGNDLVRNVPWGESGLELMADSGREIIGEGHVGFGLAEDHELSHAAIGILEMDHQGIGHLVEGVEDGIEVCGAQPHPASVEGGVRSACDDDSAVRGEPNPVAVLPNAWELLEVRLLESVVAVFSPESHRHRGNGLGDDELSELVEDLLTVRVEGCGRK